MNKTENKRNESQDFEIDFVALLKSIDDLTAEKVGEIHNHVSKKHPFGKLLEGGYHTVNSLHPFSSRRSIWVSSGIVVEDDSFSLEPDSVYAINKYGMIVYGSSPKEWLPSITEEILLVFSGNYVEAFVDKIYERKKSTKQFFSSVLNLCRSAYFFSNREIQTKSIVAKWCADKYPESKSLIQLANQYRCGQISEVMINDKLVQNAQELVYQIKNDADFICPITNFSLL